MKIIWILCRTLKPKFKGRPNKPILPVFDQIVYNIYLFSRLKIHFIHAKPSAEAHKVKKVVPLLLLHGWPGSVREFYEFIKLLVEVSDVNDYVFEVIAPSLVGYGFSDVS